LYLFFSHTLHSTSASVGNCTSSLSPSRTHPFSPFFCRARTRLGLGMGLFNWMRWDSLHLFGSSSPYWVPPLVFSDSFSPVEVSPIRDVDLGFFSASLSGPNYRRILSFLSLLVFSFWSANFSHLQKHSVTVCGPGSTLRHGFDFPFVYHCSSVYGMTDLLCWRFNNRIRPVSSPAE